MKAILDQLGLPPIAPARFIAGPSEAAWQEDVPVLPQSLR